MNCSCYDCEHEAEDRAYDLGHDEGRTAGYDDGYREARRDVVAGCLDILRTRRLGSGLPFPLYDDVMTLDEVEKMIREAGK
jgi:hypothetical protein